MHNPKYLELDDKYRGLPNLSSVLIKTSNFEQTFKDLEKIGFVAIELLSGISEETTHILRAFKGKHGACHYSGKMVKYTGSAIAALDDDNHLLTAESFQEVCEKTYLVFGLPSYKKLVERKDHSQSGRNDDRESLNVVSDDFESGQNTLYEKLKNKKERPDQRETLFYRGPFRMLILNDGSVLHRGKWCSVPKNLSESLLRKDGCIKAKAGSQGLITYFQDGYEESGSSWLLKDFNPEVHEETPSGTDFSGLSNISTGLKKRLFNLIDNQKKYFILIGNEAEDKLGCCPSEEVTEANRLVRSGILSSLAEPLQGDACPVTMYAFKGELSITSEGFSSRIDQEFRQRVQGVLGRQNAPVWKNYLKWILLGFVSVSVILAARKCQNIQGSEFTGSLFEQLDVPFEKQVVVVLFHNQKRCYQCRQMENHTNDLLQGIYGEEDGPDQLIFRTLVIDEPRNADLVATFGIFAPTLVLMEFDQQKLTRSKVLLEATVLYRDDSAFKDFVKTEINLFQGKDE